MEWRTWNLGFNVFSELRASIQLIDLEFPH